MQGKPHLFLAFTGILRHLKEDSIEQEHFDNGLYCLSSHRDSVMGAEDRPLVTDTDELWNDPESMEGHNNAAAYVVKWFASNREEGKTLLDKAHAIVLKAEDEDRLRWLDSGSKRMEMPHIHRFLKDRDAECPAISAYLSYAARGNMFSAAERWLKTDYVVHQQGHFRMTYQRDKSQDIVFTEEPDEVLGPISEDNT
jgi:hypothetical protein